MFIISSLVLFIGFYILYRTSKRVAFKQSPLQKWLQDNIKLTKSIGLVMIVISYALFIIHYGLGAGVFIGTIMLMTAGSLIIMISPLKTTK